MFMYLIYETNIEKNILKYILNYFLITFKLEYLIIIRMCFEMTNLCLLVLIKVYITQMWF